jgi:CDP-4-dehydro-6-deoxyglucose reductase
MSLQPWLVGTVIKIENETSDTKRFWIQVPSLDKFDFLPGQFVTLDLPIHEKSNKRWRSYSIASCPDGTNVFELLIVLNPSGTGTPYIFNQINVGSEITFRGPQGVFTLPQNIEKELFLICTGTGIAPFRSMINHIFKNNIPHHKIHLVFGTRTKSHLLYFDELKKLEIEHNDFFFYPTLSREDWEGENGYVHNIYERLCSSKPEAQFYLCGWKGMIDEAKSRILEIGYDKKDIHLEIYG